MDTLAGRFYLEAPIGSTVALPKAGTRLENPFVYDAAAQDVRDLARRGLVQIVSEGTVTIGTDTLTSEMVFRKLK